MKKILFFTSFIILVLLIFYLTNYIINRNYEISNLDSEGKNIICFGDSITYGEGVSDKYNYPNLLQRRLKIPVINAGKSGDTTFDALKRLKEDVLDKNPLIVIVEFGGNDYLRRIDKEKTLNNIEKVVAKIIKNNAMVVLVGVHCGILGNEYKDGLIRIAKEYGSAIIPNVQKGIFTSAYKLDYVHPNEKGYEIIANRIFKVIKKLLNLSGKSYLIKEDG